MYAGAVEKRGVDAYLGKGYALGGKLVLLAKSFDTPPEVNYPVFYRRKRSNLCNKSSGELH